MQCITCKHIGKNEENLLYCKKLYWKSEKDLFSPLNKYRQDYHYNCMEYRYFDN